MKKSGKGLTAAELVMMALGTVIGGSFFLGSTVAIKAAGVGAIGSYTFGGLLVYIILFTLSEMTVADSAPGSFRTFAEREFGPGLGFVVGWVYWTGMVLAMSSEAIALSTFLSVWIPNISLPLMGGAIISVVTLLNLLGADKLSKMESGLAFVKLFAVAGFIVLGLMIVFGIGPASPGAGLNVIRGEALLPNGIGGVAGSMLIVMFTYAGFEVIGFAASETGEPHRVVPKAISYTVFGLSGLYITSIIVLLLLIPAGKLTEEKSPLVLALSEWNMGWAGEIMSFVLITAVLSTMLAAMFGIARMLRSLAEEGHAPFWLKDKRDIPYKGILFSGAAMLLGLAFGFVLPKRVYLFLTSSGGYSLLFTYLVIVITHYKFRKNHGCPPSGNCQLFGFPYTSWVAIVSIIGILLSMPLIPGQQYGLYAGLTLTLLYSVLYFIKRKRSKPS